jgi:hypothetical protein
LRKIRSNLVHFVTSSESSCFTTVYFQTQNPNVGIHTYFGGPWKVNVGILYGPLVYYTAILHMLWSNGHFGIGIFPCFGVLPR